MNTARFTGVALIAALMVVAFSIDCRAGGPLDGTKWKIKVVPDKAAADKGEKMFDDELIFADGKFTSTACLPHGFKPSAYKGEVEEKEAEFEAEQKSETEGIANWLGEVRGNKIMGRLQWTKKDGSHLAYDFEGTKE